jgi:hypothetical protein
MSRESFVFLIGFVVFFVPFLGIPGEWKEWIMWVSGALIMFSGYKLRRAAFLRSIMSETGEHKSSAFVETVHHEIRTTRVEEGVREVHE